MKKIRSFRSDTNYSDAGTGGGLQPAMFWFANKLKDPSVLWVERSRLMNNETSKHIKDRLLPAIMIWSGGIGIQNIPKPKESVWVGGGDIPVALMRTSWSDPAAIFVGFKGGSPSVNHEVTMPPQAKGALTVLLTPENAEKQAKKQIQSLPKWPAIKRTASGL